MLLERERELAALEALLEDGGVVVIEGGAGIGKTSLVEAGCARARRRGWRVLRARGSQLETGFAFGMAGQLFERELASAGPQERAEMLAGPAGAVAELLAGQAVARGAYDTSFAFMHGLYWLTVNMASRGPVLVAVDDAHWADRASLRWLAYLAARLEGVQVAVVVALRPAEQVSGEDVLLAIRTMTPAVRPALLSGVAVAKLVRTAAGAATPDVQCSAMLEASGGNPFYLAELLRAELIRRGYEAFSRGDVPAVFEILCPGAGTHRPVVVDAPSATTLATATGTDDLEVGGSPVRPHRTVTAELTS